MLGEPGQSKVAGSKACGSILRSQERCPASDTASLSNHPTAPSNKSSEGYSSCLDYSNEEDNFAIAISALPCKQAKRKVLHTKKKLTITMSNLDEDTDNDMASAKLGKLTASYAAAPLVGKKHRRNKDAKRNPLSLSNSN